MRERLKEIGKKLGAVEMGKKDDAHAMVHDKVPHRRLAQALGWPIGVGRPIHVHRESSNAFALFGDG